jgi:glycosyltransferase involved in cell wall biosynthesis
MTHPKDETKGWNLVEVREDLKHKYGLPNEAIQFAKDVDEFLPDHTLNKMYNMMDLLYLPSQEGWGLPVTEAMACGTLTAVGDHAALSEIGRHGGSFMIEVEEDSYVPRDVLSRLRSSVVVEDVVDTFDEIKNDATEKQKDVRRANGKVFMEGLTWDKVATSWNRELTNLSY